MSHVLHPTNHRRQAAKEVVYRNTQRAYKVRPQVYHSDYDLEETYPSCHDAPGARCKCDRVESIALGKHAAAVATSMRALPPTQKKVRWEIPMLGLYRLWLRLPVPG
jgi:hypothetical protein